MEVERISSIQSPPTSYLTMVLTTINPSDFDYGYNYGYLTMVITMVLTMVITTSDFSQPSELFHPGVPALASRRSTGGAGAPSSMLGPRTAMAVVLVDGKTMGFPRGKPKETPQLVCL